MNSQLPTRAGKTTHQPSPTCSTTAVESLPSDFGVRGATIHGWNVPGGVNLAPSRIPKARVVRNDMPGCHYRGHTYAPQQFPHRERLDPVPDCVHAQ
eukprot:3296759-Prymnesium_polylepis.1